MAKPCRHDAASSRAPVDVGHCARAMSIGVLGILACQVPAQAQSLDNDVWVSAMAFVPETDTNVSVTSRDQAEISSDIDFESDLGLKRTKPLLSVNAGARLGRLILGADVFTQRRSGARNLAEQIVIDGTTYPAAARVESGLDSDIYRLSVGYALVQNSKVEIGAAVGAHVTRLKVSLAGQATLDDASARLDRVRRKVLAPLPTVGAFATLRIAPRLELNGRADYLSLDVGDYDGRLISAQLGLNYALTRSIAIGAAYRHMDYRLRVTKEDWRGSVRYQLSGPAALLQASF